MSSASRTMSLARHPSIAITDLFYQAFIESKFNKPSKFANTGENVRQSFRHFSGMWVGSNDLNDLQHFMITLHKF